FRDREDDVVAVAELELQVLALQLSAIADAVDLELVLETLGDPLYEVRDQRPIGAPHGTRALGITLGVDVDPARFDLVGDVTVQRELQGALRPLHLDGLALDIGGDARGNGNGLFSDSRHGVIPFVSDQNTVQRTSPPTLASRASWSAITPLGVDRIATPR